MLFEAVQIKTLGMQSSIDIVTSRNLQTQEYKATACYQAG